MFGADRALFNDVELHRQLTRGKTDCEIMRTLHRKAAGDLCIAAKDRLIDIRSGEDLVVEDDGEGLADILLRRSAEATRARGVELDLDVRLAGLRVEALARGR